MIQLHTFGALDLRKDGVELRSVLTQPKRAALLLYIAVGSPSGFVSRDTLLGMFWPESDATRARNALRQALHHLRRSLGEEAIVNRGERELGVDPAGVWCDALAFRKALHAGQLESALELYRGEFLPGFYVDDAPAVERMIDELRGDFRRAASAAVNELIDRHERAGELRTAAVWARRASTIAPYEEGVVRRLMVLLERCGEVAGAREAYREFELRLRTDLECAPSEATRGLFEQIRAEGSSNAPEGAAEDKPAPATGITAAPTTGITAVPAAGIAAMPAAEVKPPEVYAEIFPPVGQRSRMGGGSTRLARPAGMRGGVWLAVAVVSILVLAMFLPRSGERASSKGSEPRSIAVLPFMNMTGDAANDPFADGISEELLNVLTRISELKVAARTSSFAFKGKQADVDSIARVLGVTHVLEGSIRRAGDRVRITAQLIEARSGFHLWSDTYDRKVSDVLDVQDEISRAIAKALELQLRDWGRDGETRDAEAYRLLVRALQVFRTPGRESYAEAAMLLEEAIRRDPAYARAYGALAHIRVWQANFLYLPRDAAFAEARTLAKKSLALRETPEAHMALARLSEVEQWQPEVADEHMRRALELNPGDARAIQTRGMLLVRMGRADEGLALLRRATELDPLHPGAFSNLGIMLARVDRMNEALGAYNRALELSPEDPIVLQNLANTHAELGNHALALEALNRALARMPEDLNLKGLRAYVQVRAKQREAALASLRELESIPEFPRYRLASLYVSLDSGNLSAVAAERVITLLEQAADRREEDIAGLTEHTDFTGLREHPRMIKLLERMKSAAAAPAY